MNDKPTTTLEQKKDRRGLLALVGAGGAAALAALLSRSNGAQAHGPHEIINNTANPAIHGVNVGTGVGVKGDSRFGNGISGVARADVANPLRLAGVQGSSDIAVGVRGFSGSGDGLRAWRFDDTGAGAGVQGFSGLVGESDAPDRVGVRGVGDHTGVRGEGSGFGVHGCSPTQIGVFGRSNSGIAVGGGGQGFSGVLESDALDRVGVRGVGDQTGVRGKSDSSIGVRGGSNGVGVLGTSLTGIGVRAEVIDPAGVALDVVGKARFSTAGSATVPAGSDTSPPVPASLTANSRLLVTLAGDPGRGNVLASAVKDVPGGNFKVRLLRKSPNPVAFDFLIVES